MNISGIGGAGMQPNKAGMGAGRQMDSVSTELQKQIEKLQNDLREISANEEMTADAKMKKRQEIQKQISELEVQLRQHQIEAKRQERQKKKDESSFDDLMGTKSQGKQSNDQNVGMSTGSMEAMISAGQSVKQANVNGSIAKKMEGRANVVEIEMQLDCGRSGSSNVDLKEAELSKLQEAAQKATSSQMESLAEASETLQNAAKDEKTDREKADDKKASGTAGNEEETNTSSTATDSESSGASEVSEAVETGFAYHPVDVRL
ncbi:MAG: FlxA-like family protein [Lachnospiraceae bacterium]|nr:FlxA-like family protein [Lachnospiraceae bacterium]